MENREWIEKTEAFLRERFDASEYLNAHPNEKAYRLAHTFRVANIGRQIARGEGFDETEMTIACLLHDVSYCEDFGENGWANHGRRAAAIARPFLQSLGMPQDRIEEICYGIAIHVDDEADFPGEKTPFALSVGDADNIDRFDAYRIHAWLVRDGFLDRSLAEQAAYTQQRLNRLHELLEYPMDTETAKELWRERVTFYITFMEKLAAQIKSGTGISE